MKHTPDPPEPQLVRSIRNIMAGGPVTRRAFLAVLAPGLAATAAGMRAAFARQDTLYILKSGDLGRLRLDFNSARQKVRLIAVVAPT